MKDIIEVYGKKPIFELLTTRPELVDKVFLEEGFDDKKIIELIDSLNVKKEELKDFDQTIVHQGIVAKLKTNKLIVRYDSFINNLEINNKTCLVLLDEIQDPQNVGAIIRSASAFGLAGVLLPKHNQAPVTGSVIKASAGLAFKIPLVVIDNVNQTIRDLKEKGFWIYGLETSGKNNLDQETFDSPTVLIMGNEGKGVRQKTFELCDIGLNIPMMDNRESLNVSVAAAITFYSWYCSVK